MEVATEVGDREAGHLAPHFLPDGRHFLYFVQGAADKQGIYVSSLVDGRPRKLMDAETAAVHASGHLLFFRDHTLLAQPLDADRLTLVGPAFRLPARRSGRSTRPVLTRCRPRRTAAWRFAWAIPDHICGTRGSTGPVDISAGSGRSTRASRRPPRPISVSLSCCGTRREATTTCGRWTLVVAS